MAAVTQTGTYTGPVDLLTQFRTFILANGWTENEWSVEGSGQRFHITKTVGSDTFYLNFRALVNESVQSVSRYGIGCNGSTGFDAGDTALDQPGAPPYSGLANLATGIGSYRIAVDSDFFSITTYDSSGHVQHIVVASSAGMYGAFCSMTMGPVVSWYSNRNALLNIAGGFSPAYEYWGNHIMTGSGWFRMMSEFGSGVSNNLLAVYYQGTNSPSSGLVNPSILSNSPSPQIGIPVLFPFALFTRESSATGYRQWDGVSGIKFLNKKYINDGDTITVGGVDYVVYTANYDQPDYGIAFKVS